MPVWKIAIIAGWLVLGLALFVSPETGLIRYAKIGYGITLAAHALEFAFFHKTFSKAGGSMAEHFLMTLALGMFHIQSVRAEAEADTA